jgi:hypothetical protein
MNETTDESQDKLEAEFDRFLAVVGTIKQQLQEERLSTAKAKEEMVDIRAQLERETKSLQEERALLEKEKFLLQEKEQSLTIKEQQLQEKANRIQSILNP